MWIYVQVIVINGLMTPKELQVKWGRFFELNWPAVVSTCEDMWIYIFFGQRPVIMVVPNNLIILIISILISVGYINLTPCPLLINVSVKFFYK